jgi:hypothetical protein
VQKSITRFIEEFLYLRVNKDKTTTGYAKGKKFLGHSFYVKSKGKWSLCVHSKSYSTLKDKLRELTKRSSGRGYDKIKESLRYYIQGWVSYFKQSEMLSNIKRIDEWLCFRIRMLI